MDETQTTTTIRIDESLLDSLRDIAALEDRSLNAQIVRVLREFVEWRATQAEVEK